MGYDFFGGVCLSGRLVGILRLDCGIFLRVRTQVARILRGQEMLIDCVMRISVTEEELDLLQLDVGSYVSLPVSCEIRNRNIYFAIDSPRLAFFGSIPSENS
jgi:hypothetical protein